MVGVSFVLDKKGIVLVLVVIVLLVGAGFAVAYSDSWKSDGKVTSVSVEADSVVHGHSPNEVILVIPEGRPTDLVNGSIWIE